jgi:hypothetical protein
MGFLLPQLASTATTLHAIEELTYGEQRACLPPVLCSRTMGCETTEDGFRDHATNHSFRHRAFPEAVSPVELPIVSSDNACSQGVGPPPIARMRYLIPLVCAQCNTHPNTVAVASSAMKIRIVFRLNRWKVQPPRTWQCHSRCLASHHARKDGPVAAA